MLVCVKKWQAVISCQHSWLSCCVWCDLICVWSELLVLQVYIVIGVRRKISYLNAGVKSSSSSCLEPWLEPSKSGFSETYHTCLLTLLRFVRSLGAPVRKDSFDRNTLFSPPPPSTPHPLPHHVVKIGFVFLQILVTEFEKSIHFPETMFCAQQIKIFPWVTKYSEAICQSCIWTQPCDILQWLAAYGLLIMM